MSDPDGPRMTVALATLDTLDSLRRTIDALRRQTVKDQLEIVIVAPSGSDLRVDPAVAAEFWAVRVVEHEAIETLGSANATAVRAAKAPIVALAEDHSFPAPNWADALIAAHRGPWAAVGPALENANPDSPISWAEFLMAFGMFRAPRASAVVDRLPGHNTSYKRAVLLAYGDALEAMLAAETVLHGDLRANGYHLYLEGTTTVFHLNFELLPAFLRIRWNAGRVFAATRAQGWSLPRRLPYVVSAPLIPLVRLARMRHDLRRAPRPPRRMLPLLLLGLVVDAAGELLGYAVGAGDARREVARLEHRRDRFLRKPDSRSAER